MRGTSRSCVRTDGAVSTAHADSPRSFSIGSSAARSALGTMIAPARNLRPASSKSSSAAAMATARVLEPEGDERVVGGVLDDQRAAGPLDAAGAFTGAVTLAIAWVSTAASFTSAMVMSRMYWNVQPVSS